MCCRDRHFYSFFPHSTQMSMGTGWAVLVLYVVWLTQCLGKKQNTNDENAFLSCATGTRLQWRTWTTSSCTSPTTASTSATPSTRATQTSPCARDTNGMFTSHLEITEGERRAMIWKEMKISPKCKNCFSYPADVRELLADDWRKYIWHLGSSSWSILEWVGGVKTALGRGI